MKKYGAEEKINMKSRNKGITLMALVVTVIVVLIFYDNLFSGLNL